MPATITKARKTLFLWLVIIFLSVASSALAQQYAVTAIEPPNGYTASRAMGINNLGDVVGRFYNIDPATGDAVDRQAFIWDSTNGAVLLPKLNGESSAWEVNDDGFATGYSYDNTVAQRAVMWDTQSLTILDLGALTNQTTDQQGETSTAYGINRYGEVVGNADIPNDAGTFAPFHAFYYNETDGIYDLGTLTTDWPEWANGYSIAYGINNNGEIVGIAHDSDWNFRPFIDDENNGMQALQIDPAYETGEWYAVVINDSGLIGGHVIAATNRSFPYYWPNRSSAPIKITMPQGFPYGEIYGINASGQMVGIMWDSEQDGALEHAFIFEAGKGVKDLNDIIAGGSGWTLSFARDVNDDGQIVGYGEHQGQKQGFLLGPASGVVVDFGVVGFYYYANGVWTKLSDSDAQAITVVGNVLYVDFGTIGFWKYDGVWTKLSPSDAQGMIAIGNVLYVDFGTTGFYKLNGGWSKLKTGDAQEMYAWEGVLYVDFGPGDGFYRYDGSWTKLSTLDVQGMIGVGKDLYVDFGASGLYKYSGGLLTKVNSGDAQLMLSLRDDLYVDFGAGVGLYKYAGGVWTKLSPSDAQDMIVVNGDLYVDFGQGIGFYKYSKGVWSQLSKADVQGIIAVVTDLYADFGSTGIWKYDGAWTNIVKTDPELIVPAKLY
jgi:probable HAF family extracellular repeat protein